MYRCIVSFCQPYTFLLMLALVALVAQRRRLTRRWFWVALSSVAGLVLMSSLPVSHFALGTLEWHYRPLRERPVDVNAIVVLSGGVHFANSVRPEPELAEDSMARCAYAATLYHQQQPCTVVVTGGNRNPNPALPSCADVMRQFLLLMGVADSDIVVEPNAKTTYENAAQVRDVLESRAIHRIVLVTDALHMRRSVSCFRKQGFDVLPAPCRLRATEFDFEPYEYLPSPEAAFICQRVAHEWLGTLWYWWRGRI